MNYFSGPLSVMMVRCKSQCLVSITFFCDDHIFNILITELHYLLPVQVVHRQVTSFFITAEFNQLLWLQPFIVIMPYVQFDAVDIWNTGITGSPDRGCTEIYTTPITAEHQV